MLVFVQNKQFVGRVKFAYMAMIALMLAGCSIAPGSGPKHSSFTTGSITHYEADSANEVDFALVDVDTKVAKILKNDAPIKVTLDLPEGQRGFSQKLRVGDLISLSILESEKGGLFVNDGANLPHGNKIVFPNQRVNDNGYIKIPFAGEIKAAGLEASTLAKKIEEKLQNRAIEPQAIVAVEERSGRMVSVGGHVRVPGQFEIPLEGLRLLDALALAKGSVEQHHELMVTIQRKGRKSTARLTTIIDDPKQNIYLKDGDNVIVEIKKRFFSVLGSITTQSRRFFTSDEMTIQDGIASAYGLDDNRAHAKMVMLYRPTKREILDKIGVDLSKYDEDETIIPVIYKFDLQNPSGLFLAGAVPMQENDLIYIATSPVHDIVKLNRLLQIPGTLQNNNANAITNTDAATNVLK